MAFLRPKMVAAECTCRRRMARKLPRQYGRLQRNQFTSRNLLHRPLLHIEPPYVIRVGGGGIPMQRKKKSRNRFSQFLPIKCPPSRSAPLVNFFLHVIHIFPVIKELLFRFWWFLWLLCAAGP